MADVLHLLSCGEREEKASVWQGQSANPKKNRMLPCTELYLVLTYGRKRKSMAAVSNGLHSVSAECTVHVHTYACVQYPLQKENQQHRLKRAELELFIPVC